MIKRTDGEVQAYVDGYNACYDRFVEVLMQRGSLTKAIEKMDMFKEATNSVLLTENVGTHQQEVGTKSEKVVTLGDLIGLIDRDRENNKTISIMDENGAEQLRVLTRSPFPEDLEEYVVTNLDVGDRGWICVWLGEKKEET